jgi:hypothetical protein
MASDVAACSGVSRSWRALQSVPVWSDVDVSMAASRYAEGISSSTYIEPLRTAKPDNMEVSGINFSAKPGIETSVLSREHPQRDQRTWTNTEGKRRLDVTKPDWQLGANS